MNEATVVDRIEAIRAMASDDEMAHGEEDSLYEDILRAIAEGTCENPQECARLALTTQDIEFHRWGA
jgi:phosphate uptake regulator